ncbi:MAG: hypothetical protein HFACDABA_02879 [Anaerolineales bacterium]|nr:hypothetical protein [Anaerolineales bacterium]
MNQHCFSVLKFRINPTFFFWIGLLLTSCASLFPPPPGTATPRPPTATPVLSPTPIWFPATETPIPRPLTLPTGTPDWRPGLGNEIRVDNFSDEESWDTFESDDGVASFVDESLVLSAAPEVYLFSLNHDLTLTDFYVEATARVNICRGADEYGLLVRAIPRAYYRFAVACNGEVRAERIAGNERLILHPPYHTGNARGAPSEIRMAVWVFKNEMRFFLNDIYQFSVSDNNLPSGSIGFFVRSAGPTPVTVAFADLALQKLNYSPIATP